MLVFVCVCVCWAFESVKVNICVEQLLITAVLLCGCVCVGRLRV